MPFTIEKVTMTSFQPARVTIGLPVYNGEATLSECLENLATQTYRDFKVIIHDNASTDGTEEIARGFVEKDDRFVYIRNADNLGAGQNFLNALHAADTEFFHWRADDDLTDLNWLECMVARLERCSSAVLAVSQVESRRPARNRIKQYPFPNELFGPRLVTIAKQILFSHASWIYGLWRTEYIQIRHPDILNRYPELWAQDHLIIFQAILKSTVVGDNKTKFIQNIFSKQVPSSDTIISVEKQIIDKNKYKYNLYKLFTNICRKEINDFDFLRIEISILQFLIQFHALRRVNLSLLNMLKCKFQHI